MAAPQAALEYLRVNPQLWRQFKQKYGSLPDGFSPPEAPAGALDHLSKNPGLSPQFEEKYGYLPPEYRAAPVEPEQEEQAIPALPDRARFTDLVEGGYQAYEAKGLAGVRDYLMQHPSPELVSDFARGGDDGWQGDARALGLRSVARLGSGVVSLLELGIKKYTGYDGPQSMPEAVRKAYQDSELQMMDALRPEVRRSVESQFVERADDGSLQFGEGAADPWWWTGMAIDMGTQMAPGIGAAGKAARIAYGARYSQALAKAATAKASTKVSLRFAEKEAVKAAQKAALIAGGSTEGLIAGGQSSADVQRTLGELDEETMMNYAPYAQLREQGASHEAARQKVADDHALKAGFAVAVVTGMTGYPLNAFIGRWVSRASNVKSRIGAAAAGAGLEGSQEFVQEGAQQLFQNLSQSPITGQDPWEGVLESAITGAVVGGALGGTVGGVAGPQASADPVKSKDRILAKRVKDYNAARDNLSAAQGFASDPNVKLTKADLDEARETYRLASVALSQELLASGKLDSESQKAVAEALEEARALGTDVPEKTTDVDEKQLSKTDAAGAREGETSADPQNARAIRKTPALTATQTERLDLLNRVASAEPISDQELNTLVKEKLANVSKAGRAVLLPAGKRQRVTLKKAEEAAAQPVAEPAKTEAQKEDKAKTPKAKEPVKEPAKEPAPEAAKEAAKPREQFAAATRANLEALTEKDYGALERVGTGKEISPEEGASLVKAGLLAPRDGGKAFVVRPAGRRELKVFRDTRQTALERAHEPIVEGETLTAPKAQERRKGVQVDQAQAQRKAEREAAQKAVREKAHRKAEREKARQKASQEEAARQQAADEKIKQAAFEQKQPSDVIREALEKARTAPARVRPEGRAKPVLPEGPLSPALSLDEPLRFRHFSNLFDDEITLDPTKQGTGIPGAERRRGGERVIALYAGDHPDHLVEHGLRGKAEYEVEVARSELYDANADEQGFFEQASADGAFDMNEFERLVKAAGFKGYHTPLAEGVLRGQARLFAPTKARRLKKKMAAHVEEDGEFTPLSVAAVREAVVDIEQAFGFKVNVVFDWRSFPASVHGIPGSKQAIGLFHASPFGGEVFISAARTRSAERARVAAIHEIVGHFGLRGMLGDRYAETMESIWESFPEQVVAAARRNRIDLFTADEAQLRANRLAAAEELVAYATEQVLVKDVKQERTLWERIVQFIRDALRSMGVVRDMNEADIRDLILRSRDYVRSGREKRIRVRDFAAARLGQAAFTPNHAPLKTDERLHGMPATVELPGHGRVSAGPYEVARAVARKYMRQQGWTYQPVTNYLRVNEARAKRIAQAFEQMPHAPADPKVKAAYDALIRETLAQYRVVKETGLKVEFIEPGQPDPYASSPRYAIQDVAENNHLWVFPTESGFGSSSFDPAANPLLTETDEFIGTRRLVANDVFRIVHDYFGHVKEGVGFRADGEENAWRSHASMYSPLARAAMTTETRGQNSWVNFGPYGEQNRAATSEQTKFADQKIGLLPEEFWSLDEETSDEMESAFSIPRSAVRIGRSTDQVSSHSEHGETIARRRGDVLQVFWSNTSDNFQRRGEGLVRMQELARVADEMGLRLVSDTRVSIFAAKLYDRLELLGYSIKRNEFELQDNANGVPHLLSTDTRPVFEIVSIPGPDLMSAASFSIESVPAEIAQYMTDEEKDLVKKRTVQKLIDTFNQLPSDQEMAAVALAGQAKRGWYRRSAKAISTVFGPDAPRFVALLAAMSPKTSVESNLRNAMNVWVNWVKDWRPTKRGAIFKILGDSVKGTGGKQSVLPAWINNSVRALTSENPEAINLSGPKVNSFAANLRNETNEVTIDTWMANYAFVEQALFGGVSRGKKGEDKLKGKNMAYVAYATRLRQAADRLSQITGDKWTASEVQETIWSWAKALSELTESYGPLSSAREIIEDKDLTDDLINATPDFAGLFVQPEFAGILAGGGYSRQLGRLAKEQAGRGARAEAAPSPEGFGESLKAAADRLDRVIQQRRDQAAQPAEAAFSIEDDAPVAIGDRFRNPDDDGLIFTVVEIGYGPDRVVRIEDAKNNRASLATYKVAQLRKKLRLDDNSAMFSFAGVPTGGDPNLESFLSKIGAKPKTLKQRWQELTNDIGDRANMALFDHFFGIKRAEQLAGIASADSGYVSARLSTSGASLMRATLENGYPIWEDGAPNIAGEKGFFDIIKPLGDQVNTWLAWMVARRADRLMTEKREQLFTPAEIAAARALGDNNPAFLQAAQEYAEFKSRILDFAEEAGIVNPDTRALWDNADHIPFYRLMENGEIKSQGAGGGIGFVRNQIRKLKGGEQNLGDPLENIMKNWANMLEASIRAHAARLTIDNLDGTGLVTPADVLSFTPEGLAQFKQSYPTLVADLRSIGVDVDALTTQAFRGVQSMLTQRAPEGQDTVSVWRDGVRQFWNVHDPLLFRSLQAINPKSWSSLMNVLRAPKRFLTETITIVPEFSVKNIWRDMWSVFVQGRNDKAAIPIIPIVDSVKGLAEFVRKGEVAQSMMAGGASFEGTGYNSQDAAQAARRAARRAGVVTGIVDTPAKAYLMYRDMLSAAENAHRVAVYNRVIARGGTRKEALYEAKDLMDFSLRGNAPVVRFLVETVPFWGARVAGLSTLGRRFAADPWGVAIRGSLIALAALAYVAHNYDDERYKALTKDQKNLYWHFWDVLEEGDHWRIPKPFEVGTIFGTIPEAIMDAILTNAGEPDRALASAKLVGHAFTEALDLSPQIAGVWPVVELAINENTFTGAPILTMGDEGVLPEDQDSPGVRPTYRFLAQAMPNAAPDAFRSPKQLQHLGRGYIGSLQDYVLLVTDKMVRAATGEPAPAEKDIGDQVFFKSFVDKGPARNTKYLNEMYQIADEAEKVYRSLNRAANGPSGDARVEELLNKQDDLLSVRKSFRKAVDQVNGIRAQQRTIQVSDMPPADKKQLLDELNMAANEIAMSVWDLRPGGKLSPSTAVNLMGATKQQQVSTLRKDGLRATADLVESLPARPPAELMRAVGEQ